jgi:hypothetical protein
MEWRSLRRLFRFGVALAFLLLLSCVLVFEVKLPEANAALFNDNFSNLSNWTVVNGVWSVSGGVLQGFSPNSQEGLIWAGDASWMYYQATANVRTIGSDEAGLVVRFTDSLNYYWLGLGCWEHKYSISRVVDGVYTELAFSGLASEVEVGRWYTITAVAFVDTLQLFVDGVKVLEVQDNSHPNGAVGFRTWDGTMQAGQLVVQSLGWSKKYAIISMHATAYSVVQTSDGGYALAGTAQQRGPGYSPITAACLVKTDSVGNLLWNKTYGDYNSVFSSVVQTSDGGYVLAGTAYNYSSPLLRTAWLLKTDSVGNHLWNKTYGDATAFDSVFSSVVQTSDGGYILAGATNSFGFGGYDFWLVKTDSAGNQLWSKTYGGTGNEEASSLVQTTDGGYAITGYTESYGAGNSDFWLVKTDSTGIKQWDKIYSGSGSETAESLVQTRDGGYALAGGSSLVKTDSYGNQQWIKTYFLSVNSITMTNDGGYALAGGSSLVKTDSYGNQQWIKNIRKFKLISLCLRMGTLRRYSN